MTPTPLPGSVPATQRYAGRPAPSGHTALGDARALADAVRRAVPWAAS